MDKLNADKAYIYRRTNSDEFRGLSLECVEQFTGRRFCELFPHGVSDLTQDTLKRWEDWHRASVATGHKSKHWIGYVTYWIRWSLDNCTRPVMVVY